MDTDDMLGPPETPGDDHPGSIVDQIFQAALEARGFLNGRDVRLLATLYMLGRITETQLRATGGRPLWLIVTTAADILEEKKEKYRDEGK